MPRWIFTGLAVCLLFVAVWSLKWISSLTEDRTLDDLDSSQQPTAAQRDTRQERTPQDAEFTLDQSEYQRALKAFQRLYPGTQPTREDIYSVAGELAVAEGRHEIASQCFAAIPTSHPTYGLASRLQQGISLIELNRASAAEENLKLYLENARVAKQVRVEDVVFAFKWLNYILSVTLRLEERKRYLDELHQLGLADLLDSKQFLFPNLLILNSPNGRQKAERFAETEPNNLAANIAVARYHTMNGEYEASLTLLQAMEQRIGQADVVVASQWHAAILETYYDSGMVDQFDLAVTKLPPFSVDEPWLLTRYRGDHAVQHEQFEDAIRYFSIALEGDPANAPSQMGMVEALKGLERKEEHQSALARSSVLAKIRAHLPTVQQDSVDSLRKLIELCDSIKYDVASQILSAHVSTIQQHTNSATENSILGPASNDR